MHDPRFYDWTIYLILGYILICLIIMGPLRIYTTILGLCLICGVLIHKTLDIHNDARYVALAGIVGYGLILILGCNEPEKGWPKWLWSRLIK
jgi:hypothetical protein